MTAIQVLTVLILGAIGASCVAVGPRRTWNGFLVCLQVFAMVVLDVLSNVAVAIVSILAAIFS